MSAPRIPPSSTSSTDTARPGLRAKTVATRLSPEELQEVENAAERDGKSRGVVARAGPSGRLVSGQRTRSSCCWPS
jgi:hypothetical protein